MENPSNYNRRQFLGTAAMTTLAAQFIGIDLISAREIEQSASKVLVNQSTIAAFEEIKQINAGVLDIGYAELGPADGKPVILLHGWPYSIYSYRDSAQLLALQGYRVLVPHLRGHGSTTFLSKQTPRNGQQAAIAADILAFMDALKIGKAIIGGYDWGARAANTIAALWPERCIAMVSVSGYLIGNQEVNKKPLAPKDELSWWYQFYFATERGRVGYEQNRLAFARLIWNSASPKWHFSEEHFERTASVLNNADHVDIVISNYRWRLGLEKGEPTYNKYEEILAKFPVITVPTVTLEGDANGAPHKQPADYASKFKGKYMHRNLLGGIGHNPPEEAPGAFAAAIIEADTLAGKA